MFLTNQLGSVSALSMAANPAALPVLAAVAGIGITVGAAAFVYHEYKEYEEKKHKEEIDNINRLHKKYLARISVPDYNEIQGFPAIFVIPEKKDAKDVAAIQSMHLTDEQIRDIGNTMPRGTDIVLCTYRQQVLSAILKLKEYYFSRSTKTDITAGVIGYLLYMLETKCLNFEGYAYDIAYLNAITNFINAFASVKNTEKSQHFSRLQPVYSYLLSAKQTLEKHKEALSLEEIIGELRDSCENYNNQLLRCLVKMVSKNKYWELTQTVAIDELEQGLLRRKYIQAEVKSLVLKSDDEVKLPDSIFKFWVKALTEFFLKTLNPDNSLTSKDIVSPTALFALPDIDRLPKYNHDLEKSKKPKENSIEVEMIEKELKGISNVFKKCQNFITTRVEQKNRADAPKFVAVTDPHELINRSKVLADFATLIHELISLQYLSAQLLKSIKQLGEIYVKNPRHFCNIFHILENVCDQLKDRLEKTQNDFVTIQQANNNAMQLESKEVFPGQVKDVLNATYAMINRLGTSVKQYRIKVAKNINNNEPTMESVKHEMFEAAKLLASTYQLQNKMPKHKTEDNNIKRLSAAPLQPAQVPAVAPTPEVKPPVVVIARKPLPTPPPSRKPSVIPNDASKAPVLLFPINPAITDIKKHADDVVVNPPVVVPPPVPAPAPVIEIPQAIHNETNAVAEIISAPENKDPDRVLKKTGAMLDNIHKRIEEIQNTEKPEEHKAAEFKQEINAYNNLYNDLTAIVRKASALVNESNKTQERNNKTGLMLELTLHLCMQTEDFLQLDKEYRIKNAKIFAKYIHDQLVNPRNNFIDQHYSSISRAAYSISGSSLFATDSRKKLNRVNQDSDAIVRVLDPK